MYVSCLALALALAAEDSWTDPSVFSMAATLVAISWICSMRVCGLSSVSGPWWHLVLLLSLSLFEPMVLDCF
jgi:hypothetical protein